MPLRSKLILTILTLTLLPQGAAKGEIIATVGERSTTRSQLEQHARDRLQPLEIQRHEILSAALEELVAQELFTLEAERRGLSLDDLIETEIASQITVSQEEIDAFFEKNRSRIQGSREASLCAAE